MTCPECHNEFQLGHYSICYHCARPSYYANVDAAENADEVKGLDDRYQQAKLDAIASGTVGELTAFEVTMDNVEVTIARYFNELTRLLLKDNNVYGTFYHMIDAGMTVPDDDKWNRARTIAEEILFPGYKDNMTFAALTLNRQGVPHYGDCHLVFREDMTSHRTSLLEENCVIWVERRQATALKMPAGYRSNWSRRKQLAVAKLAGDITPGMTSNDLPGLLLQPRSGDPADEEDKFIEAHIWGPWTRRTLKHVTITGAHSATDSNFMLVMAKLNEANITSDVL